MVRLTLRYSASSAAVRTSSGIELLTYQGRRASKPQRRAPSARRTRGPLLLAANTVNLVFYQVVARHPVVKRANLGVLQLLS
jgi:hypothetical protein